MGRQFWPIERTDVSAIVLPIVRVVGPEVLFIIHDHLSPPRRESSTQGTKKILSSRESSLPISNFASQRRWKAQVVYTWQSLGSFDHQLLVVDKMPNPDRQWFASSLRSLSKSLLYRTAQQGWIVWCWETLAVSWLIPARVSSVSWCRVLKCPSLLTCCDVYNYDFGFWSCLSVPYRPGPIF